MSFNHVGMALPGEVVQVLQQFLFGDDRTRVVNEIFEDSVFHGSEIDALSGNRYRLFRKVEAKASDLKESGFDSLPSAYQGSPPGNEFSQIERLRQIIVRPKIEEVYGALRSGRSGQDQHRRSHIALAQFAQNVLPWQLWKHQIKNNEIVGCGLAQQKGPVTVVTQIDGVARTLSECRGDILSQPDFVFDNQYAHVPRIDGGSQTHFREDGSFPSHLEGRNCLSSTRKQQAQGSMTIKARLTLRFS
jgi:hypothetical protein